MFQHDAGFLKLNTTPGTAKLLKYPRFAKQLLISIFFTKFAPELYN